MVLTVREADVSLRKKQSQFALNVAMLILEAEKRGYEVTLGDAYRDPRATFPYSHPKSNHKNRLAIDLNLFKDGEFIKDSRGHRDLHAWFEEYCGGAPMIDNDPNHYSFEHEGMR